MTRTVSILSDSGILKQLDLCDKRPEGITRKVKIDPNGKNNQIGAVFPSSYLISASCGFLPRRPRTP